MSFAIFVGGPAIGAWCAISSPWWWVGLPIGALLIAVVVWAVWGFVREVRDRFGVRVVPQFERRLLEDPDTYFSGCLIARNFKMLDALALKNGLSSLSSFGLLRSDTTWHDSAAFGATLAKLLRVVGELPDLRAVHTELSCIQNAIHRAEAENVRCRLVVVSGTAMNAMLWNRLRDSGF